MRPEFITFADDGLAVEVVKVSDAGRYRVVDTRCGDHSIKLLVDEGAARSRGRRAPALRSRTRPASTAMAGS